MHAAAGTDGNPVRRFFLAALVGISVCAVAVTLALGPGNRPTVSLLCEFPESIRTVAVDDRTLLVAAAEAGLFRVEPYTGEVTRLFSVGGQGITDVVLAQGTAYALAYSTADRRSILHLIDPVSGTVNRSIALSGSVADLAGVLPNGQLVIIEAGQVRFVDADNGRTRTRVVVSGGLLGNGCLTKDRLYVSRAYAGGVAIIDIAKGELIEVIEVDDWLTDVEVADQRAYVVGNEGGLASIDLAARTSTPLAYADVFVSPGGATYALDRDAVHRLGASGEPVDVARIPGALGDEIDKGHATIVAVESDYVLIARGRSLYKLVSPWKNPEA